MKAVEYDSTFTGFLPVFLEEPCKSTYVNPLSSFVSSISVCFVMDTGIYSGVVISYF